MTEVSEYEAKRLRRIEENRKKLQSLNLPTIEAPSPPQSQRRKRKRDVQEQPLEPTRKSKRQRKQRKLERQQRRAEKQLRQAEKEERKKEEKIEQKRLAKLEKKTLKRLKKQKMLEKKLKKQLKAGISQDTQPSEHPKEQENDQQQEQPPRILDWRLRRKLQAQEDRRKASLKRREERKVLREKEKKKKLRLKVRDRKIRKKIMEREKLEKAVEKELALQRRIEEGEMMRAEDRLSKLWAKQQAREARMKILQEKRTLKEKRVAEKLMMKEKKKQDKQQEKDDALYAETYPVRQIRLPFVRISDAMETDETKPLVLTPQLKVDPNNFHMFSLGKQFLPPGKKTVMQGLCPGGFTAKFRDDVDIHVWKNAMTLFVNGTTGMFYHYMFEEATLRGRKHVFFRWTRCQHVTPPILSRLSQVQKGEELLRIENYYTPTPSTGKPEPLLLFIQYPNGPYIYCGRLGYLGYRSNPLEFSFQLLDIKALNWAQIRTLITSC